jgi:anti-sigma B factor antagonist
LSATAHLPAGPGLHIFSEHDDDAVVVRLEGELELSTVAGVHEALVQALSADCARLVVDLRGLDFLDSAGINALVQAHQRCLGSERSLSLMVAPGHVQRVLEVSGILTLLDHTTEETLAA